MVPSEFNEIAEKMARKYPADIKRAAEEASERIRKLPMFESFVNEMVDSTILRMIHDARHRDNVRIKKQNNEYGGPAKVVTASSAELNRIGEETSLFMIKTTFGNLKDLTKKQLTTLSETNMKVGRGFIRNARFFGQVAKNMPDGIKVSDFHTEETLRVAYREGYHGFVDVSKIAGKRKDKTAKAS